MSELTAASSCGSIGSVVEAGCVVVWMATENPTWGYTRLVGALDNLGHQVGRNTVKRVLRRHGLEPAPVRGKRMPWKTLRLLRGVEPRFR